MFTEIYQVTTVMSDGYYSVQDGFEAMLNPADKAALEAEFATLLRAGVLQEATVALIQPTVTGVADALVRVDRFVKRYPTRHFGGPGGGR
jgi:hypothetical protein